MALNFSEKERIVANLKAVAERATSAVLVDFTGIPVGQMNEMRRLASEKQVKLFVLHNRLTQRALAATPFNFLTPYLQGPCMCAFSMEHPREGARLLKEKAKKDKQVALKGGGFEGQYLSAAAIDWLSQLPTRQEALGQLLGALKEVIGGKLARALLAVVQSMESKAG